MMGKKRMITLICVITITFSMILSGNFPLMPGEMIQQDLKLIFKNPADEIVPVIVPMEEMPGNYMLTENSPALHSGEELSEVIPEEAFQLFPDYDFYRNIEGEPRSSNGSVNIGAF